MIAGHRGLFGLGLVLSLGVTCCMLTALVFLPALLRLRGHRTKEDRELRIEDRTAGPWRKAA